MKPKILCVIPTRCQDLTFETLRSILNQTIIVDAIIIFPNSDTPGETVGQKVSWVLNTRLPYIKIEAFDYILRVDADTVLPANFIEENLKGEPDICGQSGCAMLIKTSTFLRVMNGKFHPLSDDSYTFYKFMKEGCSFQKWRVKPIVMRAGGLHHRASYFKKPKHHNVLRFYNRGKTMYRLGYEPLHVFGRLRHSIWNAFAVFGYLIALIKHEKKFDVADFVWHKQVKKLMRLFSRSALKTQTLRRNNRWFSEILKKTS